MANRFWVGGTATWDGTAGTKWATTSGGAGGAAVPTSADDVFFDGNSGTGTITLATGQSCLTLDFTGFTGTFAHNSNVALTVAGNLYRLSAGMTFSTTASGTTARIDFTSTSGTCLITTAGKSMCSMTFNGVGGTFQLQDALTTLATHTVTLTNGTLDTNGQTCSWGAFSSSNSNTRVLTLGASSISITRNAGSWSTSTATGMTLNPGTSTINMNNGNQTFSGGGLTYNNLVFLASSGGDFALDGANTFANLTYTPTSGAIRMTISANQTVTGTFTGTGVDANNYGYIRSSAVGTARTITAAAVSISNICFSDITGAGAGTWSGTLIGDMGGNSGITFTTPVTRYWVDANGGSANTTASWSASSGGASGATVPLPQDTVVFDANSITAPASTITWNLQCTPSLDLSNVLNSPSLTFNITNGRIFLRGDFVVPSTVAVTNTVTLELFGRSSQVLNTNSASITGSITVFSSGGTYTLSSALVLSGTLTLTNGTFNANGYNVTCGLFSSTNSNTRTLTMGSGTWTLTGTGTVWNFSTTTNLTYNVNTSTVTVTDTSSATKTLNFAPPTAFNNLVIPGGGTGNINLTASGGRAITSMSVTGPKTITWASGSSYTITNAPTITSSRSQPVTFLSSTPGTQYTLSVASGIVGSRYMSIFDCIGTGGATFVARSSYGNNTTGWTIVPPRINQAMATLSYALNFPNNAAVDVVSASNSGVSANGSWSLCAWINVTGYTGTRQDIHGVNFTPTNSAISIGGTGLYVLNDPIGLASTTVRAPIGRMVPVVTTWDATNSRGCMYFDGYLIYTRTGTAAAFTDGRIVTGRFAFSASQPAWGAVSRRRVFARELTAAEVMAWSRDNVEPDSTGLRAQYNLLAGSGSTDVDTSGNGNNGTITGATWVTDRVYTARTAAANRTAIPTPVAGVAATGTITVTDYQYLAGKASTATITVTDYTAMTGGTLDVLGFIIVTEGVDFNAVTSNNQTAINLAAAIDAAAGSSVTTVVGPAITISAPGSNDGGPLTWDTGGLTPTSTTFTGGYDITVLYFGSAFQPFQVAGGAGTIDPGLSNSQCASNIATAINGGDVTAVADGAVVTITYNTVGTVGNAWAMSQQAQSAGTISNGLTLSGATLSGGTNAIVGRTAASNRVQL